MNLKHTSWSSARNICIVQTLAKLGHYPTRTTEKEAWFLSPLRSETQASFSVSLEKNLWYDYGLGQGGNTIDLFMKLHNCSFGEAIKVLENDFFLFSFCPRINSVSNTLNNNIEIRCYHGLNHPALFEYISRREIPHGIAATYCKEVWYRYKNRDFFAIGLENHLGGWELRNKYYKNSSSPKSYSIIDHSSTRLVVTEGIFDFLSLVVFKRELVENADCIILNSLAFLRDIHHLFPKYSEVQIFLDNDTAGKKATKELLAYYTNIIDCSDSYSGFKDINEKLMCDVE